MSVSKELGAIPYEKSNNVEVSLFQKHGRITRKAFFFRLFLCLIVWLSFHAYYIYWDKPNYDACNRTESGALLPGFRKIEIRHQIATAVDFYILPSLLLIFMMIQAIKRAHDVNFSGWWLLAPFFNLYLILGKTTPKDNDYGLLPHNYKKVPEYSRSQN